MPATSPFSYDVFLSHNSKDKPRVRKLAGRLKDAGLRVWFDEWVIKLSDDIYLAIERGLEAARVQVLCLSPEALGSGWVTLERSTVLFRDPTNAGRRFIPMLLADCELPDALRRYKYVDFRHETQAAFDELLAACRSETESAPPAPQPKPKKKPAKKKPEPLKLQEQAEPLAVLERKLTGHTNWVRSVAVSPDGTWVASGSHDKTVRIWDLKTGKCRATLEGHADVVRSIAITPDAKVVSSSQDSTVCLWDVEGKRKSLTKQFGDQWILCTEQIGEGTQLLSCIAKPDESVGRIVLWDRSSQRESWSAEQNFVPASISSALRFGRLVCGLSSGEIGLLHVETGERLATLKGHSSLVNSVRSRQGGRFAVSGSADNTVKVWDLEAGTCVGTFEGHESAVHSVAISPDGALIASAGFTDHTVRLWDWKSGTCLQVIRQERYITPLSVAFSPDGSRLVVGTAEGQIFIYRLTGVCPAPATEAMRRYVNAKVVLLGEGAVGKTSLAHRLIEDKYVVKDRTHGMNVWPLDLPDEGQVANQPGGKRLVCNLPHVDREALLWDLAGQEDYRLIHRLFLDETALALLLINPQKDDPFAEAGDWLKSLETAVGSHESKRDAARLLIFSQIDVGGMKLGKAKIERFRKDYGFAGWLATSAKTGENCSDQENGGKPSKLKRLIADSIPWDKLPWTATPRILAELKTAVMTMRDKADIRLLRFAELAQRLEQALPGERFGESDVRTAVTLLANHGLARPLKFGDLVLLRPVLLIGYAGAIIRAARAHTDEIGCVLEANIYKPDFDFTGVDRLTNRPDEDLLLRAMAQTFLDHSLCIAEETPQGRHLVFPSQYRREKDIPHEPNIFVSYTFGGEWQTVWTTLVVRLWYSQVFRHKELWRNAAEFLSDEGHTLGLKIDNKQGEGVATISLYFDKEVPPELKAIFMKYLHGHLDRYGCVVSRDRRYVCDNCGKAVRDVNEVRKRLAAGKEFITCQGCDERVMLIDFIEQWLKSDPVAQKILAMEETATRELGTRAEEQIVIGHVQAITGEANQIFRELIKFGYGIDGEIEFKDNDGQPSGKKIYVQLKSGNSYLRTRKKDGHEVFDAKNDRHLDYWISQPVDVYLVIRQTDERTGDETIRWMNVTRYLKNRTDKTSRQIIFDGEPLTMEAVWKVRDAFFPPRRDRARALR